MDSFRLYNVFPKKKLFVSPEFLNGKLPYIYIFKIKRKESK